MSTVPLAEAQFKLQDLITEVAQSHEPILISGNVSNAFLVSEEDWKGIQETIVQVPNGNFLSQELTF